MLLGVHIVSQCRAMLNYHTSDCNQHLTYVLMSPMVSDMCGFVLHRMSILELLCMCAWACDVLMPITLMMPTE